MSPKERRFDSIGYLIEGNDQCGAACFNGKLLLLATNSNKLTKLADLIAEYLIFIADEDNFYSEERKKKKSKILEYAKTNILNHQNEVFHKVFLKDLNKVTKSMHLYFLNSNDTRAFSKGFVKALKDRCILVIKDTKVHAELKIIDYLWRNNKERFSKDLFFIGISKKCCKNCACVLRAINRVYGNCLEAEIKENVIRVSDEPHANLYKAEIPKFLIEDKKLQDAFLDIRNVDSLEQAFYTDEITYFKEKERHDASESSEGSSIGIIKPASQKKTVDYDSPSDESNKFDFEWKIQKNKKHHRKEIKKENLPSLNVKKEISSPSREKSPKMHRFFSTNSSKKQSFQNKPTYLKQNSQPGKQSLTSKYSTKFSSILSHHQSSKKILKEENERSNKDVNYRSSLSRK